MRRETEFLEDENEQFEKPKKFKINIFAIILVFVFAALATLGIIKLVKSDGDNSVNEYLATFVFDDSVTDLERARVEKAFENHHYQKKIEFKISAETIKYQLPENYVYTASEGQLQPRAFAEIRVPVVDFYDGTTDISAEAAETATFLPISELTPEKRLVSIDGNYFLDTFTSGAEFRIISFDCGDSENNSLASTVFSGVDPDSKYLTLLNNNTLSFAQTGVTAITRDLTNTLNGRANGNGAYFAEKIKDFLSAKDLTHISNESSFIDGCKGGRDTMMLCSDWRTLDTIKAIGTDIVELTGNHNNNFGADANIATIDAYHESSMVTVGGGKNSAEAARPVRIIDDTIDDSTMANQTGDTSQPEDTGEETGCADESGCSAEDDYTIVKNNRRANITLLAYNQSTSTVGNGELSTPNRPGANGWDEENAKSEIEKAKSRGDFVIVDIQYFECYCYPGYFGEYPTCDYPIANQQSFFRHLIDLGADMVIGTQAHQPQTFEIYNGKPIYYGLGNLFFDQTYWLDTKRGLILTHYFADGKYIQTRISPTTYDTTHQVELMSSADATKYLNRLINASAKGE